MCFIECCVPAFLFWYFCGFYLFYFVPKTKKGASNTFHTSDRHLPPSTYFFVVSNNNWVFVSCNNNWVPCCDCLLSSTVVKNKKKIFFSSFRLWFLKFQNSTWISFRRRTFIVDAHTTNKIQKHHSTSNTTKTTPQNIPPKLPLLNPLPHFSAPDPLPKICPLLVPAAVQV